MRLSHHIRNKTALWTRGESTRSSSTTQQLKITNEAKGRVVEPAADCSPLKRPPDTHFKG